MPELPVLTTLADGVPEVIDTQQGLSEAIEQLATSRASVAVDTERAQGFRYGAEAWLVQIRRADVGTFLIDSHALPKLAELNAVLDAPWIFHAAGQDLPSLAELDLVPPALFDTEVAARLTGVQHFSLQGVCEEVLGFSLEKAHQNENWSVRPLPLPWLRYAAMDVEVLPQLETALTERLEELGRLEWARQEFDYELTHPIKSKAPRWENLKGVGKLRRPQELAIARELWTTREEIAVRTDVSPGRILNGRGILEAALRDPQNRRSLQQIEFFRRPQARRYLDEWWEAIRRAHSLLPEEMPHGLPAGEGIPPARLWKRLRPEAQDRLQQVRALVERAAKPLDLAPEVVLLPATQRLLAWEPLDDLEQRLIEGEARPWQRELILAASKS